MRRPGALLRGVVSEFDEPRGLGVVVCEGVVYSFHCTAIADGTRTIAVGTQVVFVVVPGHLGRLEAGELSAAAAP